MLKEYQFRKGGKSFMKIFVIMGKSCSGKDTLVQSIMQTIKLQKVNNFEFIVPYTTRNPRDEKERYSGVYNFVTDEEMNLLISSDGFVEVRAYDMHGEGLRRFATVLPELDPNKNYILIGTKEVATVLLRRNFDVRTIYLTVPTPVRLTRMMTRVNETNGNYGEALRRFIQDEEDFAEIPECLHVKEIDSSEFKTYYNEVVNYMISEIEDSVD